MSCAPSLMTNRPSLRRPDDQARDTQGAITWHHDVNGAAPILSSMTATL